MQGELPPGDTPVRLDPNSAPGGCTHPDTSGPEARLVQEDLSDPFAPAHLFVQVPPVGPETLSDPEDRILWNLARLILSVRELLSQRLESRPPRPPHLHHLVQGDPEGPLAQPHRAVLEDQMDPPPLCRHGILGGQPLALHPVPALVRLRRHGPDSRSPGLGRGSEL